MCILLRFKFCDIRDHLEIVQIKELKNRWRVFKFVYMCKLQRIPLITTAFSLG